MKHKRYFVFIFLLISVSALGQKQDFKRHHFQLYPFELMNRNIGLGYEYFPAPKSRKLDRSYNALMNIAIDKIFYEFNLDHRIFITNADTIEFYVGWINAGYVKIDYFLGPSFVTIKHNKDIAMGLRISNGIVFQFARGLSLTALAAIGPSTYIYSPDPARTKDVEFWVINFVLGWRF